MQAQTMRRIRQYHLYLGVFFAPLIIFFALSGALQTFRLQEEKGWGSTPPSWIVWMASVHKDSALPRAKPAAAPAQAGAGHADDADEPAAPAGVKPPTGEALAIQAPADKKPAAKAPAPGKSKLPMRILAVLMSVGLMFSALLGVTIALNSKATRRVSILMIAAGSLVPFLLL
jgi:hypothetical protein